MTSSSPVAGKTPFDPIEFYYFASELFNNTPVADAASRNWRVIVGRAYYGALIAARDVAQLTACGGDSHKRVIDHYASKKRAGVSNRLKDLKAKREGADYRMNECVDRRAAGESLRLAKEILRDLGLI